MDEKLSESNDFASSCCTAAICLTDIKYLQMCEHIEKKEKRNTVLMLLTAVKNEQQSLFAQVGDAYKCIVIYFYLKRWEDFCGCVIKIFKGKFYLLP